ncbi:MAG: hypothetical protein JOZ75_01005 [Candidatus Dormibacteraeota bacterium]|nr:hypothetical protein [Candidatus Dormibacteraeota bacterium]
MNGVRAPVARAAATMRGVMADPRAAATRLGALASRLSTAPALWALVIYGAGAFLLTSAAWHDPSNSWPGGCCDPQQSAWFLRWAPYALAHGINPFVTYQLNSPDGVNLMWNASFMALGIIASPITLLFGPVVAYNVLISAGMALGGWFTYFVVRRYTSGVAGPMVAGAIYAFSPYTTQQAILHLQVMFTVLVPLFVLVLDSLFIRRSRPPWVLGALLGLLAALQLLIFEEILATLTIFVVVGLVALGWGRWTDVRERLASGVEALGAAALTFVVLCAWPLYVQFLGPQRIHGAVQDTNAFSTDLLNLVLPTQYQRVSPAAATVISQHFSGLDGEATAYIGLPLLILLVAFVATHWRDIRVRTASVVAGVALIFSLGPHLHIGGQSTGWPLPWWPFAQLPLLQDALPSRLSLYMWLGIAVLVAIAVETAIHAQCWRRTAAGLAAIAVSLAAILPAGLGVWQADTPAFFQSYARHGIPASSVVLIAPFFRDGAGASPMLWAAVAGGGVRMPEAYAFIPAPDGTPMYGPPATNLSTIMEQIQDTGVVIIARGPERDAVAGELSRLQITHIIVGPMDKRAQMVAFFTDLLGREPQNVGGVQLWSNVQQEGVAPAPS